jgi:hypothetical protein
MKNEVKTQEETVKVTGVLVAVEVTEEDFTTAKVLTNKGETLYMYLDTNNLETNMTFGRAWFLIKNKLKVTFECVKHENSFFNGKLVECEKFSLDKFREKRNAK